MSNLVPKNQNLERLHKILAQLADSSLPAQEHDLVNQAVNLTTELENGIQQLEEKSLAAAQDKAKFVSVVTHELRIPLTSIKGYTDLLRQKLVGPINEQQSNFLNIIRTNVDRMSALISDLSDISHIQSGRLKPHLIKTNINTLITDILFTWEPRLVEKKQVISVQADENIPDFQVDTARLKQVLGYLLSNSNGYSPQYAEIKLRVINQGDWLRIEVHDEGLGISQADQNRLFTPFFRSEDEAIRELPGWGLSLHVAKLLTELMGGKIGASSQLRNGSAFWLEIPLMI